MAAKLPILVSQHSNSELEIASTPVLDFGFNSRDNQLLKKLLKPTKRKYLSKKREKQETRRKRNKFENKRTVSKKKKRKIELINNRKHIQKFSRYKNGGQKCDSYPQLLHLGPGKTGSSGLIQDLHSSNYFFKRTSKFEEWQLVSYLQQPMFYKRGLSFYLPFLCRFSAPVCFFSLT